VQNSANIGLTSNESRVHLFNSTIKNGARSGISVTGGTFDVDGGTTVTGNARNGISATTAHLRLNGGDGTPGTENVISNNGAAGLSIANSATADQCDG